MKQPVPLNGQVVSKDNDQLIAQAKRVLLIEAAAVSSLADQLSNGLDVLFAKACRLILACRGRVVVTGMGKSGHIARKIAATLASTGTPAFFLHSGEASHGDFGMITAEDVLLSLSHSGETDELLELLPMIKRIAVPLIVFTGNANARLAKAATVPIVIRVNEEACPLGLAPTASTTAALAMGDALAVALLEARGFSAEDFARSHPGGRLGRRLLITVGDIMHTGKEMPQVSMHQPLGEALAEMSCKGLGVTSIMNESDEVVGIFTDGDLRRALDASIDIHNTPISSVMNRQFKTIHPQLLAAEALQHMEKFKINSLLVLDEKQHLVGVLNMHDLLKAGVI